MCLGLEKKWLIAATHFLLIKKAVTYPESHKVVN